MRMGQISEKARVCSLDNCVSTYVGSRSWRRRRSYTRVIDLSNATNLDFARYTRDNLHDINTAKPN